MNNKNQKNAIYSFTPESDLPYSQIGQVVNNGTQMTNHRTNNNMQQMVDNDLYVENRLMQLSSYQPGPKPDDDRVESGPDGYKCFSAGSSGRLQILQKKDRPIDSSVLESGIGPTNKVFSDGQGVVACAADGVYYSENASSPGFKKIGNAVASSFDVSDGLVLLGCADGVYAISQTIDSAGDDSIIRGLVRLSREGAVQNCTAVKYDPDERTVYAAAEGACFKAKYSKLEQDSLKFERVQLTDSSGFPIKTSIGAIERADPSLFAPGEYMFCTSDGRIMQQKKCDSVLLKQDSVQADIRCCVRSGDSVYAAGRSGTYRVSELDSKKVDDEEVFAMAAQRSGNVIWQALSEGVRTIDVKNGKRQTSEPARVESLSEAKSHNSQAPCAVAKVGGSAKYLNEFGIFRDIDGMPDVEGKFLYSNDSTIFAGTADSLSVFSISAFDDEIIDDPVDAVSGYSAPTGGTIVKIAKINAFDAVTTTGSDTLVGVNTENGFFISAPDGRRHVLEKNEKLVDFGQLNFQFKIEDTLYTFFVLTENALRLYDGMFQNEFDVEGVKLDGLEYAFNSFTDTYSAAYVAAGNKLLKLAKSERLSSADAVVEVPCFDDETESGYPCSAAISSLYTACDWSLVPGTEDFLKSSDGNVFYFGEGSLYQVSQKQSISSFQSRTQVDVADFESGRQLDDDVFAAASDGLYALERTEKEYDEDELSSEPLSSWFDWTKKADLSDAHKVVVDDYNERLYVAAADGLHVFEAGEDGFDFSKDASRLTAYDVEDVAVSETGGHAAVVEKDGSSGLAYDAVVYDTRACEFEDLDELTEYRIFECGSDEYAAYAGADGVLKYGKLVKAGGGEEAPYIEVKPVGGKAVDGVKSVAFDEFKTSMFACGESGVSAFALENGFPDAAAETTVFDGMKCVGMFGFATDIDSIDEPPAGESGKLDQYQNMFVYGENTLAVIRESLTTKNVGGVDEYSSPEYEFQKLIKLEGGEIIGACVSFGDQRNPFGANTAFDGAGVFVLVEAEGVCQLRKYVFGMGVENGKSDGKIVKAELVGAVELDGFDKPYIVPFVFRNAYFGTASWAIVSCRDKTEFYDQNLMPRMSLDFGIEYGFSSADKVSEDRDVDTYISVPDDTECRIYMLPKRLKTDVESISDLVEKSEFVIKSSAFGSGRFYTPVFDSDSGFCGAVRFGSEYAVEMAEGSVEWLQASGISDRLIDFVARDGSTLFYKAAGVMYEYGINDKQERELFDFQPNIECAAYKNGKIYFITYYNTCDPTNSGTPSQGDGCEILCYLKQYDIESRQVKTICQIEIEDEAQTPTAIKFGMEYEVQDFGEGGSSKSENRVQMMFAMTGFDKSLSDNGQRFVLIYGKNNKIACAGQIQQSSTISRFVQAQNVKQAAQAVREYEDEGMYVAAYPSDVLYSSYPSSGQYEFGERWIYSLMSGEEKAQLDFTFGAAGFVLDGREGVLQVTEDDIEGMSRIIVQSGGESRLLPADGWTGPVIGAAAGSDGGIRYATPAGIWTPRRATATTPCVKFVEAFKLEEDGNLYFAAPASDDETVFAVYREGSSYVHGYSRKLGLVYKYDIALQSYGAGEEGGNANPTNVAPGRIIYSFTPGFAAISDLKSGADPDYPIYNGSSKYVGETYGLNLAAVRKTAPDAEILGVWRIGKRWYVVLPNGVFSSSGMGSEYQFKQVGRGRTQDGYFGALVRIGGDRLLAGSLDGIWTVQFQKDKYGNVVPMTYKNSSQSSEPVYDIREFQGYGFEPYAHTEGSTVFVSDTGKKWTRMLNAPSAVKSVERVSEKTFWLATDEGLFYTKYEYDMIDNLQSFDAAECRKIFDEYQDEISDAYEDAKNDHMRRLHVGGSAVQFMNEYLVGTDFSGLGTAAWHQQGYKADGHRLSARNDIVYECEFGDETTGDFRLQTENHLGRNAQAKYRYVIKKYMSGVNELTMYVPTTNTYYISHAGHLKDCQVSPSRAFQRQNLGRFGSQKNVISSEMSSYFTRLTLKVPRTFAHFDEVMDVGIYGSSLPLAVYRPAKSASAAENPDYSELEEPYNQMYHSAIMPSVVGTYPLSSTDYDEDENYNFEFACFGTDAQSIRLQYVDMDNRATVKKYRIIFHSNGADGANTRQLMRATYASKLYDVNQMFSWPSGNSKMFAGWTFEQSPADNKSEMYPGRPLIPNKAEFFLGDYIEEYEHFTGVRFERDLSNMPDERQIHLYAAWLVYQFSDNDTTLELDATTQPVHIAKIETDPTLNPRIGNTVMISYEQE